MSSQTEHTLRHELANSRQENVVLKGLVKQAAEQLDDVVNEECSEDATARARQTADRLHQASR